MNTIQNGTDLMATMIEFAKSKYAQKKHEILNMTLIVAIILSAINLIYLFYSQEESALFLHIVSVLIPAFYFFASWVVGPDSLLSNKRFLNLVENGALCDMMLDREKNKVHVWIFVPPTNAIYEDEGVKDFISFMVKRFFQGNIYFLCFVQVYTIVPQTSVSNLSTDLDQILKNNLYSSAVSLPNEIAEKAKDLSEVYLYLYVVENSLRMFIRNVAIRNFGNNYFPRLKITRDIQKSITVRKENEEKNKWLSLRGNEELFYLDFKDLATVIGENWELFKGHFDSQPWIRTKIEELANIRNLVAHNNSYIDQHNKDVLRINYHQILKQIAKT